MTSPPVHPRLHLFIHAVLMQQILWTILLALSLFGATVACGSKPASPDESSRSQDEKGMQQEPKMLRAEATYQLADIEEPSGLSLTADSTGLWIVTDEGGLYRTDFEGHSISARQFGDRDFEGVWAGAHGLYVAEEDQFTLYRFDSAGLKLLKRVPLSNTHDNDPKNGLEALCFMPETEEIWTFTERDPVVNYRLPPDLSTQSPRLLPEAIAEVSACAVHGGYVWLLSDKAQQLIKLRPDPLAIKARWQVPLENPEGLTFLPDGRLLILSDQEAEMVRFAPPEE